MILGEVNANLEAVVSLLVRSPQGAEREITAVIDTGFNGFLTLPVAVISELALPWLSRQQGELANGEIDVFDVHEGTILWQDQYRKVEIEVAEAVPLIGMALLLDHELRIKVRVHDSVAITPLGPN
jgi:clan AA aspartic protease